MHYAADEEEFYEGYPLIATLIASAVALARLALPIRWDLAEQSVGLRLGMVAGEVLVGTAVLWGLAWWITIRRSSPAWKTGSFITIALVNLFVSLAQFGAPQAALKQQTDQVASEMRRALIEGENYKPGAAGKDAGAALRMQRVLLNGMVDDFRAYEEEAVAAGIDDLSLDIDSKKHAALTRCGHIEALAGRARTHYAKRIETYIAESRKVGAQAVASGELPKSFVDGFFNDAASARERFRQRWEIRAGVAEANAKVCRILRDRPWTRENGQTLFYNGGDADAVNAEIARINKLVAEDRVIQQAARDNSLKMLRDPPK